MNKGVYCAQHNNDFSRHVSVLSEQMKGWNSILLVLHDRTGLAPAYPVVVGDGRTLTHRGGHAEVKVVDIDKSKIDFDKPETLRHRMVFNSKEEATQWIARQRANGIELSSEEAVPSQPKFYESPTMQLSLGGQETFRAIAYVALTHFAHFFPTAARGAGLKAIKSYIVQDEDRSFVSWERPSDLAVGAASPFEFAHTLILNVSPEGEATAIVSLFGCLTFSVLLGTVPDTQPAMITLHIDPLAPRPPGDIHVVREDGQVLKVADPSNINENLATAMPEMIASMQGFLSKMSRHVSRRDLALVLPLFEALRTVPTTSLNSGVADVLTSDFKVRTLVLQLGERVVRQVAETLEEIPELAPLVDLVRDIYRLEPVRESGLSANTEVLLHAWCLSLTPLIEAMVLEAAVDIDRLEEVLAGDVGEKRLRDVLLQILNSVSGGPTIVFADG